MGYYPYQQECIHGHRWGAAFSSVTMTDSGVKKCPECGCYKVRSVWDIPGECWMAHAGKQEGSWGNYDPKKKDLEWDTNNENENEALGR